MIERINPRHLACIVMSAVFVTAVGCTPNTTTAPDDGDAVPMTDSTGSATGVMADDFPHRALSSDGTFLVAYGTEPGDIPLNEVFDVRVAVFDAANPTEPLRDVTFEIDGRMPHHRHGMLRAPRVKQRADGAFDVSGMLFHMPGYWELHFDVGRAGSVERAQASLELD